MPSATVPLSADEVRTYVDPGDHFDLQSRGNQILIFSKGVPQPDPKAKDALERQIDQVAKLGKFTVVLRVPHASALGDLGSKMKTFGYDEFKIDQAGPDKIRVSSAGAPECRTWLAFLTGVRDLARHIDPVSPVEKVFYLNGTDVSSVLNSGSPAGAVGGNATQKKTPKDGAFAAKGETLPDQTGGGDDATSGAKAPDEASVDNKATTALRSQPDTKRPDAAATTTTPLASTPDLLVFSEPNPGDDAAVSEKRRIIAMLDLPRPEMLVNVWSSQISSDNPNQVAEETRSLQKLVSDFNDHLQTAIYQGWSSVKKQAATTSTFYDPAFYQYLAYRAVADNQTEPSPHADPEESADQTAANNFLSGTFRSASLNPTFRSEWGLCRADQYCLGYTELFHPLKPRLTDLLLAVIAARDPANAADMALNAMENEAGSPQSVHGEACEDLDVRLDENGPKFECFRRMASMVFNTTDRSFRPYALGVLRTAIADFLYNWKIANQYPHEFSAYDLGQSAQAFNTAISPLIDAFNRDLAAYETALRAEFVANTTLSKKSNSKAFTNSGIVSVRTVSGKQTIVDTQTQSFLDVSEPPTLSQLADSITKAGGENFPVGVKNDITTAAVAGAISSMQPSEAKIGRGLKIDLMPRALNGAASAEIDVVMNVNESSEPTLYTGRKQGDTVDNTSRVASHNTTTKMRVDSLKIFQVSSLTARLQRARTRIPLIPPLVELPYVGTIVGIPRKPAVEYHSSIAVLSAVVIPTAADLAYGTRFEADRIVSSVPGDARTGYVFRPAVTLSDLDQRVPAFHRLISNCFATGSARPVPQWSPVPPGRMAPEDCQALTLHAIPKQER